tara:strand:+ start:281 stop:718 length:438 start_codon:yes stop_codon:yes gene_type:complete
MWKIIIISLFFTTLIYASEASFLMLKNEKVNVRYGPGFKYPIKFIYKKRFLPVKVIDNKENFRRIIDHKNNSGWIHISQLKKINSLIVSEDTILFSKASKFSKPVAKIKSGRLLLVKKCEDRWCKIKTGEYTGWVDSKYLWGSIK